MLLLAVAFAVLRVRAAIFAPVIGIALAPRALCAFLVVVVVRVVLAFRSLPASPPLALAR